MSKTRHNISVTVKTDRILRLVAVSCDIVRRNYRLENNIIKTADACYGILNSLLFYFAFFFIRNMSPCATAALHKVFAVGE